VRVVTVTWSQADSAICSLLLLPYLQVHVCMCVCVCV
jgi:hypothetical protein